MSNSVFTDSFIEKIRTKLDEICTEGNTITRGQLCKALEFEQIMEPVIGTALALGVVEGYDMRKGRGVGKKGETPTRKASEPEFTEEWLGLLQATLEDMCPVDNKCVPRRDIVAAMGEEGTKAENKVSLALKRSQIDEFEARIGRYGGVRRVLADTVEDTQNTQETEAEEQDTTQAVADEIPEVVETTEVPEVVVAPDNYEEISNTPSPYRSANSPIARHHAQLRAEQENNSE